MNADELSASAAGMRLFDSKVKGVTIVQRDNGNELLIHFDRVHIIWVNTSRGEARLFENGESKEGTLIIKGDEPAAKVSVNDVAQLIEMGLRYGVSYDLLSRVASFSAQKAFEVLGVKALLDKVAELTTEEEKRQRFAGFEFSYTVQQPNGDKPKEEEKSAEAAADGPSGSAVRKKPTK
jgi:hypothetical protein